MVHVGNQVYTAMALNGPPEWLTVYEVYGDDEEWCQLLVSVTHPMIHPPSLYEPFRRAQDTSGKLYRNVPTDRIQQLLDSEGSGRRAREEPEDDDEAGLCTKSAQCDRPAGHTGRCNKKRRSEEQAPPPYEGWGAVTTRVVVTTTTRRRARASTRERRAGAASERARGPARFGVGRRGRGRTGPPESATRAWTPVYRCRPGCLAHRVGLVTSKVVGGWVPLKMRGALNIEVAPFKEK